MILVFTSPNIRNLKDYVGFNDGAFRRSENWIIFSKFEHSFVSHIYNNKYRDLRTDTYIGVFSNFYKIKTTKEIIKPKDRDAEKNDWLIK